MFLRVLLYISALLCLFLSVQAEVPHSINYQGRLIGDSGEPVPDGTYGVTFTFYDHPTEVAGHEIWTSGERDVSVVNGLFTYPLGSITPFPSTLVADTSLWLGVRISGESEMAPRTQMTTVPFAGRANIADAVSDEGDRWLNEDGDTLMDDLYFDTDGQAGYIDLGFGAASLYLKDDGKDMAKLTGNNIGVLSLYNSDIEKRQVALTATNGHGGLLRLNDPTGTLSAILSAGDGSSDKAGSLILYNGDANYETRMESGGNGGSISFYKNGDYRMRFDAEHDGDESMALMDDAINSEEILNEPGIAANYDNVGIELTSGLVTEDVITVSLTTPGPGYVVVTARALGAHYGTTGAAVSWAQIDKYAGGSMVYPHYIAWGGYSYPTEDVHYESLFTQRVYYESEAGTYTYRLEATRSSSDAGAHHTISSPVIIATYYPTSYGSVNSFVSQSEAGDFDNVEYIGASNSIVDPDGKAEDGVKVDLRELEMEVNRLRRELRQREIELEEAQQYIDENEIDAEVRP